MKKALIISFFFFFSCTNITAQQPDLVVPAGHSNSFGNIYFSPDGSRVATTAFKSKMVAIWDVKAGKLLASFNDTLAFWGFTNVQFSPDGSKLLTTGGENMLWDIEKKQFIGYFNGHPDVEAEDSETDNRSGHTFTPDGKAIAFCSDSLVIFTIPGSNKIIRTLNNRYPVLSFSINRKGNYLLCTTTKETLLWNISSGDIIKQFEKRNNFFTADGEHIISITPDRVELLDGKTGTLISRAEKPLVDTALLSGDGKRLILLQNNSGKVNNYHAYLFIAETGAQLYEWKNIANAWFYPDNKSIIVTKEIPRKINEEEEFSYPAQIEVWDASSLKLTSSRKDMLSHIISEKKDRMAFVTENLIKIYNVKTGNLLREWNWHGHIPFYLLQLNKTGDRMITYGNYINLWDSEKGEMLASGYLGYDESEYEDWASLFFSGNQKYFAALKKDKWQLYDATDGRLLLQSVKKGNNIIKAAFSNDNKQLCIVSIPETTTGSAEIIELTGRKIIRKFSYPGKELIHVAYTPCDSFLLLADESSNNTEIRSATNFQKIKIIPGIFRGEFDTGGSRFITTEAGNSVSYIWNKNNWSQLMRLNGVIHFSPDGKKVVNNAGNIIDLESGRIVMTLEKIDDLYSSADGEMAGLDIVYPHYSPDGKKIIATLVSSGSGGDFPSVDVWDAATGRQLKKFDSTASDNEYVSLSGKKVLLVPVDGDRDMQILDTDTGDTLQLLLSKEGRRSYHAEFSADDRHLYTSDDQVMKKWEVATGRLLYTFFPVDSTSGITRIPSGYYSCSPDAAKLLHYVRGLQVISFSQLDIRYNRPDKVLEHIGYPDTSLTEAYRKAWFKRLKKAGIDTSYFKNQFSVPEADFVNREETDDEQSTEKITLQVRAADSSVFLDRFNIWINEVPLFGMKGVSILSRQSREFDTTITLSLSKGENSIEVSVTNINGVENFRSPLLVKYLPSSALRIPEKVHFIGIGINRFLQQNYNLSWSVKDIKDLAASLKRKYGANCSIDTLFNEKATTENIKALKKKLNNTAINDKVVIAYSGHGLLSKDLDYYLSTYNVNFSQPEENGLPYDELENLVDNIPARKKLMLIDACHSGEVDKEEGIAMNKAADSLGLSKGIIIDQPQQQQHVGLKNSFELMQSLFVNVGKSTGATIISAAAGNQFALERGDLKNGVFTYSILEAMKKYPNLKISALKKIVGDRVLQLTNGLQKPTSRNENISVDWSLW